MTFEVIKADDGKFRWRLRDANGNLVVVPPRAAMKVPGTPAQKRRSAAAVQRMLADRFETQTVGK